MNIKCSQCRQIIAIATTSILKWLFTSLQNIWELRQGRNPARVHWCQRSRTNNHYLESTDYYFFKGLFFLSVPVYQKCNKGKPYYFELDGGRFIINWTVWFDLFYFYKPFTRFSTGFVCRRLYVRSLMKRIDHTDFYISHFYQQVTRYESFLRLHIEVHHKGSDSPGSNRPAVDGLGCSWGTRPLLETQAALRPLWWGGGGNQHGRTLVAVEMEAF